nr:hypothetical protein [Pedobacter sp. ASV2]
MQLTFKSLYHLENDKISIIEIEKTNLPANAEVYDRFKWLKLDKLTNKISTFQFQSMKVNEEDQERNFEGAYLRFNAIEATFYEDNHTEQSLTNNSKNGISDFAKQLIIDYLANEE